MKRYIFPKLLCLTLALGLMPLVAEAQESNIEVVTTYTPDIAPATKLLAPTVIADDPRYDPDITYQVNPSIWQISLDSHNFNPARASYWDYTSYKRLFAKAAASYPLGSEARIRYTMQTPKVGYFGVGVDHVGDFAARKGVGGVKHSIADSYSMSNEASVIGGLFVGRYLLDGALKYDNDIFNGYAMMDPYRFVYHDADLKVRFGDEFVDFSRLNFAVEAHAGLWGHNLPQDGSHVEKALEYSAGGKVKLARNFGKNYISLDLDGDAWKSDYRSELAVGGTVGYARSFGFISVDAGLGYIFDRVMTRTKASHYILPRAKVLFDLDKASFAPYVEISTDVQRNNLNNLFELNPYIDYSYSPRAIETIDNTVKYNLSLGCTGTLFASRLGYHAYVGATHVQNQLFWFVSGPGQFSVATGGNNRIFVGVGAESMPIAGLKINLGYHYHYDINKSKYAISESNMRANLGVEYTLSKWKFNLNGQMLGRRVWSVLPAADAKSEAVSEPMGEFTMPLCFDLGVSASYRINRMIEVYVNGQNLLNSKIYDFASYYRPGIGAMAGVKIDF